jgi:hypothetical protein
MGGGLMQLVAYGAQDIYLTGNPQITFFKVVYRRHTNFACESIEQTFNGSVDFDRRVTATISRNGDLVKGMHLEVVLGGGISCYGVGNAMIKTVELEIGGQLIDRHYGEWMNIWTELSMPEGKRAGYDDMVGNLPQLGNLNVAGTDYIDGNRSGKRFYVPLQFWFCRNPGLALPLIALQYHEVKINLDLNPATLLTATTGRTAVTMTSCQLYVDYVYLDTDERRRFAQVSHEYLIEQVQFTGDESVTNDSSKNVTLNFNHPVKELIWVARSGAADVHLFDFRDTHAAETGGVDDTFNTAKLQLNGHDRFTERNSDYFRKYQNWEHHSRVPRTVNYGNDQHGDRGQYIYTYSFALSPEEHQPSGTCNFSRIDNAVLQLTNVNLTDNGVLKVFAVNYNVLRIMSGMGGLAYSN